MGLSLIPWAIAGILALGGVGYFLHCEEAKKDQANFLGQIKAQAEAQERGNKKRADRERQQKEQSDEKIKQELSNERLHNARLRNAARTGASLVPTTSSCAGSTDAAAFDRSQLDGALRNFTEGVSALIGEGSEAIIVLNEVKMWRLKLSTELGKD